MGGWDQAAWRDRFLPRGSACATGALLGTAEGLARPAIHTGKMQEGEGMGKA